MWGPPDIRIISSANTFACIYNISHSLLDNGDDLIRVPKGLHGFILEVVESIRIVHGGCSQIK